ncbi:Aste57867_14007 [Aphanomyces stellatus]|uniref:Aste57867_14007 protein n=1 Tax=Aphanomyces stellatus TaxID=120398 RepID=A0A485KZJ9_9STRA|nr:hypothetical protein As57867_013956 [Aphanomyces stellatus]VFT90837.1 Aste57867_14007 [Aphanomyces stellatus]
MRSVPRSTALITPFPLQDPTKLNPTTVMRNPIQADEVEALEAIYGADAMHISDTTVLVTFKDSIALSFEMSAEYPENRQCPEITVSYLHSKYTFSTDALIETMTAAADSSLAFGQVCLFDMLAAATAFLDTAATQDKENDDAVNRITTPLQDSPKQTEKAKKWAAADPLRRRKSPAAPPPSPPPKTTSMRTATDVIHRMLWDDQINQHEVVVGYLDRFIGVMERPITSFNWGDMAALSHTETAIPKHRIQYFKWKGDIVWDKRCRLDRVFGSSGDAVVDFTSPVVASSSSTNSGQQATLALEPAPYFPPFYANHDRPNAFLCVRITAPAVVAACRAVQDALVAHTPGLRAALLPPEKLHCTLSMLRLQSAEDLAVVRHVLDEARGFIRATLAAAPLVLARVGHFANRVVHAHIQGPAIQELATGLQRRLAACGISLVGNHDPFQAHVTLAKLTRELNKTIPSIDRAAYATMADAPLGDQAVDAVELCATGATLLDADGFYCRLAPSLDLTEVLSVSTTTTLADDNVPPLASPSVVILRGVPGSGKSTLARAVAATCAARGWSHRVCSADAYFDDHGRQFDKTKLGDAHAACQDEFVDALAAKCDVVVVDNTNVDARHVQTYVELVASLSASEYAIHVWQLDAADLAACVRRSIHDIPSDVALRYAQHGVEPLAADVRCAVVTTVVPAAALSPPPTRTSILAHAPPVAYAAVFLDDVSKKRLRQHCTPLHAKVVADHVTIAFQPTMAMLATLHLGSTVSFNATAAAANADVQAVVVDAPANIGLANWSNGTPHVTLSVAPGVAPKASHALLASTHAVPLPFAIPLSGVVGFVLAHSHERVTSLAGLVQVTSSSSPSSSLSSSVTIPDHVTTLHVFDFDLTLVRPPLRHHGIHALTPAQQAAVGPDWYKSPYSLHHTQRLVALPALAELHDVLNSPADEMGVVLTARHTALEASIRDVLVSMVGAAPDAIVCKPDHLHAALPASMASDAHAAARTAENAAFKLGILSTWLSSSTSSIGRLVVYEDDDGILDALYRWSATWSHRVDIQIIDAKQLVTKPYTVHQWLKNLGRVPSPAFAAAADAILRDLASWGGGRVTPFGSFALGRASDLDVMLEIPDDESPRDAIRRVATTLRRHGLHDVYESGSSRCPLLKVRWGDARATAWIDVDVVVCHASAAATTATMPASAWTSSDPDTRALLGPWSLADTRATLASSGIAPDVFARSVDVVVAQLKAKQLHGTAYNGVPTFKLVAAVADYCRRLDTPRPLKDVVAGFYASDPTLDYDHVYVGPHLRACVQEAWHDAKHIVADASFPSSGSLARLVQRRGPCVDASHVVSLAVAFAPTMLATEWTLTQWVNWALAKGWRELVKTHAIEVDPMVPAAGMLRTFGVLGDVTRTLKHLEALAKQLATESGGMIQLTVVKPTASPPRPPASPPRSPTSSASQHTLMKFPRTKHLLPSPSISRDDLVLDPLDAAAFLHTPITCQEKVDGANLGFFLDADFKVVAQNRSHFTSSETAPQFKGLDVWIQVHQFELCELLSPPGRYVLYGEWLYAQHSIPYSKLPSYFLAFDLFDRETNSFWSVEKLADTLAETSIHMVPTVFRGTCSNLGQLQALLETPSQFYDGLVEGVVIRKETTDGTLHARAKLVRDDFIQHIDAHWTKKGVVKNQLKFF